MHAIHVRTDHGARRSPARGPFPWEEAHAAPEDRALGLELELIELVARRAALSDDDRGAASLDREIALTRSQLGAITPLLLAG